MSWRYASSGAVALALVAGAAVVGSSWGSYGDWVHLVMGVSVVGGLLVLGVVWLWRDQHPRWRWLVFVILTGAVMRLLVAGPGRELSDDAARYHWDGKVLAHGINPYRFAPDEQAVAHLKIHAVDTRINHPWNRTCYPPLAEVLFAIAYRLSPGRLWGLQILGFLGELLSWLLLARELARHRRSACWLLPMVWGPVFVFQGYLPGHVDVLTLPFITLLVLAVRGGQQWRAGIFLALACLVKPLPLIWLPAMAMALGWRRTGQLLTVFLVVTGAAYLPFLGAGWKLFSSTWLMATTWSFNGSVGAIFEAVMPRGEAHLLAGGLMVGLVLMVVWKVRDFTSAALWSQVVFVVLTPTLFPWYLLGMYPLLVLRPRLSLLLLGALVPLADEVMVGFRATGSWQPQVWVQVVEYVPFYAAVVLEGLSTRSFPGWFGHRGMSRSP